MAGSCRQTFNFVLGWEHREPLLFMVPVRWKEGRKEGRACPWVEVGKLLGWGSSCDTRIPRDTSDQTHRSTGRERERERERDRDRDWGSVLLELGQEFSPFVNTLRESLVVSYLLV